MASLAARWRHSNLLILVTLRKGNHPGQAYVRRDLESRSYMFKRRGAKIDVCGTPFLSRRSLLGLLSPMVRIEFLFRTSSMIIRTMCLSGRSLSSLQVRPRCHTVS